MPATLYFDPAELILPEVGATFDIDIKARDTNDLESFTLFVKYDNEFLKFRSKRLKSLKRRLRSAVREVEQMRESDSSQAQTNTNS